MGIAVGEGFLAGLVRDWEAEANRAQALGVRVVSPRFGMVISRRGGVLPQITLPFRFGAGGPVGSGRQWMSWIALEDAVDDLLQRPEAPVVHVRRGKFDIDQRWDTEFSVLRMPP